MEKIQKMVFEYDQGAGHGVIARENFEEGAKTILKKLWEAYNIGGTTYLLEKMNCFINELKI